MGGGLRTGRTTGTCAAAAAMAGTRFLLTGETPEVVDAPLPPGGTLAVPIERYERDFGRQNGDRDSVRVTVIKDGGDDPDATHGCEVRAVVRLDRDADTPLAVTLDGGEGVGRATLPGLPVPVGQAAINPEPRKQIERAVRLAAEGLAAGRVDVVIEIPEGETIALKTLNPRLGILGGISILGTQGIVKPYSHASWKATIEEGLDVARAMGLPEPVFTTGRRSERFYLEAHPDMPEQALIQAADFFAFAMRAAADRGFERVTWAVFFGKLVKQAQGVEYTHARTHPVDFGLLAERCLEAGADPALAPAVCSANTAIQVLDLLKDDPARPALVRLLADRAARAAGGHCAGRCRATYAVFDFDGHPL
ncbi:cobalt-precorrin-5B (C(1))-methyltransferase CbiD [Pseudodesulfovibrio indicus]|uniref:Cobalt-precorrin-5B C(1)-methyltransferase n=1 Tax=Pseudodesulfovibrio indicus TaxID=1716143 RepID=A0A126QM53_9BACT|nr:cobalt-precorrin-5B (C(1))-methyltransferase CbiD [Pseudodesulfovibrio indicus]AMK10505.1 cobalt-precorrin-6A synthase [Pseudodesulfovibrio indicus]TDT89095.1 cobalt-precorrin-5B (C1)-methyltransferase [Pseudodesulfovibrio indicus]